jgi:oxygen-dependent protoporphyrinogen oxidase
LTNIVVVGGGIAGLATAYYLQDKPNVSVSLIEADKRLGGKIITDRPDGFVIDGGPDSFLTQKPWAVELCRQLGLGDRLIGTNEARRRVYVLWKKKLHVLPDGVLLIIPTRFTPFALSSLISPLGKLRMGMDLVIPPRRDVTDETVASFVRRRLGSEALDKIAEPLMGGIHVSDPERQSLQASFPRFVDLERKHGSLIRGMLASRRRHATQAAAKPLPTFMTLRGGVGELVDTLVEKMAAVRIISGRRAVQIEREASGGYQLRLDDASFLQADAVVLAAPAYVAGSLLSGLDAAVADILGEIRYVSTATVSFGYDAASFGHPLNGFGFVIPSKEDRAISACTWSSSKYENRAPDGKVLLRCFVGGATHQERALVDDAAMIQSARDELAALMGVHADPEVTRVFRWTRANAQYDVGHLDRVAGMEARLAANLPGVYLTGSPYRGVGIPDCVHNANITAGRIMAGRQD